MEAVAVVKSQEGTRPVISAVDCVVVLLIVLIGAIQFIYYPHTGDFVSDPGYPDLARSILDHGTYQLDYLPETTLPPGFAFLLAAAGRFFGLSPAVQFRVIAIFTILGLIVAYELVRRLEGRGVAAAACLLLGSSPLLFGFNTGVVFPEMPYFFASMLSLLLALKIDRHESPRTPIAWVLVLGIAIVSAILLRSVAIALVVGLCTWIAASFLTSPQIGRCRLRRFWLPLVLGIAAQASWSTWAQRHEVLEWQLPGYPQSYTAQLAVKNGQYPELGYAKLSDIPSRVERNISTRTALLSQLLTGRYISGFLSSPAIFGVLALIVIGLASSLRNGGQLLDWYFLWEEAIFVFWPWDAKPRFLFPIVPLAVLYLWRGGKLLWNCAVQQPKRTGPWIFVCGAILTVISAAFALRVLPFDVDPGHARGDRWQPIAATAFWAALAIIGLGMSKWPAPLTPLKRPAAVAIMRSVGVLVLAVLLCTGLIQQVALGQYNLSRDITKASSYPEITAAEWIRAHEPPSEIILARDNDTVFHYSGRRVVWFPPISNAKVLMEGIRRHHVGVLVVAHHPDSYWLPPEDVCFQVLARSYASTFHMVNHGHNFEIFEVAAH